MQIHHQRCPLNYALSLILLLPFLHGCGGSVTVPSVDQPQPPARPTLIVGTAASAPPFVYEKNNQVVGLEIDLAHELGKRLKREVRIVSMFWPDLIFELKNKRIDIIMAGMSITDQRKLEVAFAKPYLQTGLQAVIRKSDADKWSDPADLNRENTTIGVEINSTGAAYARKHFSRATIKTLPTVAAAVDELKRDQLDAVIHDGPAVAWLIHHDSTHNLVELGSLLTDDAIAWAVRLDNPTLLDEVNQALQAMQMDGTLPRILTNWLDRTDD